MASTNDNMEGGINFKWSDKYEKIFCELCIKFIRKNGRVSFKWKEINQEFEAIIKRKCLHKTLKNKYDSIKKDWRTWKFLKFGETGLRWDPVTGKLNCSEEWWDRKIKEKPEAKKFRNRSIDSSLEELWAQLFEDTYATGANVVTPSMDPNFVQPVEHVNVNIEEGDKEIGEEDNRYYESDGDNVYSNYGRHASRIDNLLNDERSFWPNFMQEVSNTQEPSQGLSGTQIPKEGDGTNRTTQTQNMTNKANKGKHKRRQSGGVAKLSNQIDTLISNSNKALEMMHSESSVSGHGNASSTIDVALSFINRMVTECHLEKGSELWCFVISLIENEVRREIFLKLEDDTCRKTWLMYMHGKEK